MCDEDIEAVDDIDQRCRLIRLPLLDGIGRLGNDDEVVYVALVVDLGDLSVCAHCGWLVASVF